MTSQHRTLSRMGANGFASFCGLIDNAHTGIPAVVLIQCREVRLKM